MLKAGAQIYTQKILKEIEPGAASLACVVSGQEIELDIDAVVLVTDRLSNDALYSNLEPAQQKGKLASLRVIGDAEAPGIIAQAVFSGHLAAREFDEDPSDKTPFKVERIMV